MENDEIIFADLKEKISKNNNYTIWEYFEHRKAELSGNDKLLEQCLDIFIEKNEHLAYSLMAHGTKYSYSNFEISSNIWEKSLIYAVDKNSNKGYYARKALLYHINNPIEYSLKLCDILLRDSVGDCDAWPILKKISKMRDNDNKEIVDMRLEKIITHIGQYPQSQLPDLTVLESLKDNTKISSMLVNAYKKEIKMYEDEQLMEFKDIGDEDSSNNWFKEDMKEIDKYKDILKKYE